MVSIKHIRVTQWDHMLVPGEGTDEEECGPSPRTQSRCPAQQNQPGQEKQRSVRRVVCSAGGSREVRYDADRVR